ncbi:MAG: NAD(P)H-dependent oxidoreductase [Acetobacteraceae bacterium]|nr:NAD(P)H-dependent oxidoreductase [Acetobacteraceae bacterium]
MPASEDRYKIAVLIGSLRAASFTRKLAKALIALAPDDLACEVVEIGDLPLYNEDLEAQAPAAWTRFRRAIKAADGVLFATAEYNRSIPGCLKNAIDVGSRPFGQNVFDGRAGAVISQTPGAMGGFGANHAVRQSLVFLNVPVMQQPEAYIGHVGTLFGEDGAITREDTRAFLAAFMRAYAAWVHLTLPRHRLRRDGEPADANDRATAQD